MGDQVHSASPICSEHLHHVQLPPACPVSKHYSSRFSIQTNNPNTIEDSGVDISHVLTYQSLENISREQVAQKCKSVQNVCCLTSWPPSLHLEAHLECGANHTERFHPHPFLNPSGAFQNSACKSCFIQGSQLVPAWRALNRTISGQQI